MGAVAEWNRSVAKGATGPDCSGPHRGWWARAETLPTGLLNVYEEVQNSRQILPKCWLLS